MFTLHISADLTFGSPGRCGVRGFKASGRLYEPMYARTAGRLSAVATCVLYMQAMQAQKQADNWDLQCEVNSSGCTIAYPRAHTQG